uniref:Uncharacterized protein n=1 Tax=Amphora coffeiformis TaxID=265554 RepID=A0A7S3LCQ7_9STRA|mmetsp:Transcript_10935/g.22371  ORF Transcript_10935/g.22371 Transcript_10935/m.22371 type:complete len:217 (+) Transcript_10935:10-660(+)|eukprot:scaffold2081_cov255-Amphora_coffeaeformis.AAC.2
MEILLGPNSVPLTFVLRSQFQRPHIQNQTQIKRPRLLFHPTTMNARQRSSIPLSAFADCDTKSPIDASSNDPVVSPSVQERNPRKARGVRFSENLRDSMRLSKRLDPSCWWDRNEMKEIHQNNINIVQMAKKNKNIVRQRNDSIRGLEQYIKPCKKAPLDAYRRLILEAYEVGDDSKADIAIQVSHQALANAQRTAKRDTREAFKSAFTSWVTYVD